MNIDFSNLNELLQRLISARSFSGEESVTADLLHNFLTLKSVTVERIKNNIIVKNKNFDPSRQSILLNTHHDTVRPTGSWTRDPFKADFLGDKIFGLGSNDAGGCIISLINIFLDLYDREELKKNIILVLSAEEEISGKNGIESVLKDLKSIEYGIVGEPTGMNMAIAEKGLMVLDCEVLGKTGHAARNEGENAIYEALKDINWFRNFQFPKISKMLGPVKMTVTMIHAGTQHNVIPDLCTFTVDLRSTDEYSHEEILEIIRFNVNCNLKPRSTRLNPSGIPDSHSLTLAGKKIGLKLFGSDALSDQALMPFPSVKIGPGESSRSHMADEYITVPEIEYGMKIYKELLTELLK